MEALKCHWRRDCLCPSQIRFLLQRGVVAIARIVVVDVRYQKLLYTLAGFGELKGARFFPLHSTPIQWSLFCCADAKSIDLGKVIALWIDLQDTVNRLIDSSKSLSYEGQHANSGIRQVRLLAGTSNHTRV